MEERTREIVARASGVTRGRSGVKPNGTGGGNKAMLTRRRVAHVQDVSSLFPDVVNCMQTDDLEMKKLVYLYLINYAKSKPDLAIMAVNTFVKVRTRAFDRLETNESTRIR